MASRALAGVVASGTRVLVKSAVFSVSSSIQLRYRITSRKRCIELHQGCSTHVLSGLVLLRGRLNRVQPHFDSGLVYQALVWSLSLRKNPEEKLDLLFRHLYSRYGVSIINTDIAIMIPTQGMIYKIFFFELLLVIRSTGISDPFTRSCPALPDISGYGHLAFEGVITSLVPERSGHLSAVVRVGKIYQGASDLRSVESIKQIQRAYSCGHLHRVGDTRIWVAKRHSGGGLTAKASLAKLQDNVVEVQKRLKGM